MDKDNKLDRITSETSTIMQAATVGIDTFLTLAKMYPELPVAIVKTLALKFVLDHEDMILEQADAAMAKANDPEYQAKVNKLIRDHNGSIESIVNMLKNL